jgi:hypothetical protein
MKKNNGQASRARPAMDYAATAMEQMELYCTAHAGSPSSIRRPQLLFRSELWIALLGRAWKKALSGSGLLSRQPCARSMLNTWLDYARPRKLSGQLGTHPKADPNSGAEVSSCMTLVAHCSSRLSYPTVQSG